MDLYAFQLVGVDHMASRRVAWLGDEMGLGKTIQAIVAADRIHARNILVITPAIARPSWMREFLTCQEPDRSVQTICSAADARDLTGDVIITSYALAPTITGKEFDLMILDEAQALKTPGSARTKAIYGREGHIPNVKRVWLLSGTLAPNHPGELWTHYKALFRGPLSYWEFVNRYCVVKETTYGTQIVGANLARAPELAAIFQPHALRRRLQDVHLEMPDWRWSHLPVLPENVPPQPNLTVEMKAILGRIERDEAISATDAMHLATLRRWTGIAKAPAVAELVKNDLESIDKLVVFAVYRQTIKYLEEAIGPSAAVIHGDTPQARRQELIDAFQNTDQPRVLVLQIATAGTALTLHRSHNVVFAETTWTPADVVQAAKRCHRIGQRSSVLVRVVSLAGSIDEIVAAVITRKARELAELESLIARPAA